MVNRELKKAKVWLDVNKLSLNIDKTNYIILKSPQHSILGLVIVKIGDHPIKQTCHVKFLGLLLDQRYGYSNFMLIQQIQEKMGVACTALSVKVILIIQKI